MGETKLSCAHCAAPLDPKSGAICGGCHKKALANSDTRRIPAPGHDIRTTLEYHGKDGSDQEFPCTIFVDASKGVFGVKQIFGQESPTWQLPLQDVIDAVRRSL